MNLTMYIPILNQVYVKFCPKFPLLYHRCAKLLQSKRTEIIQTVLEIIVTQRLFEVLYTRHVFCAFCIVFAICLYIYLPILMDDKKSSTFKKRLSFLQCFRFEQKIATYYCYTRSCETSENTFYSGWDSSSIFFQWDKILTKLFTKMIQ